MWVFVCVHTPLWKWLLHFPIHLLLNRDKRGELARSSTVELWTWNTLFVCMHSPFLVYVHSICQPERPQDEKSPCPLCAYTLLRLTPPFSHASGVQKYDWEKRGEQARSFTMKLWTLSENEYRFSTHLLHKSAILTGGENRLEAPPWNYAYGIMFLWELIDNLVFCRSTIETRWENWPMKWRMCNNVCLCFVYVDDCSPTFPHLCVLLDFVLQTRRK